MAKKVEVKLVKSTISRLPNQRATVKALGLRKINSSVTIELNEATAGMIRTVAHLVEVKELK
ncbi:MAG: 50S ribosomal protein L30 [Spirochaetaceae bacterium]|nr:50S ribosomal protein L30 [Spirochaetaceae bacterium]